MPDLTKVARSKVHRFRASLPTSTSPTRQLQSPFTDKPLLDSTLGQPGPRRKDFDFSLLAISQATPLVAGWTTSRIYYASANGSKHMVASLPHGIASRNVILARFGLHWVHYHKAAQPQVHLQHCLLPLASWFTRITKECAPQPRKLRLSRYTEFGLMDHGSVDVWSSRRWLSCSALKPADKA